MTAKLSSFERLVRDYEVQSWKAADDDLKMAGIHLGHARLTCKRTSDAQHCTVGYLGQDTRRRLGDRARATVHQLTASSNATGREEGEDEATTAPTPLAAETR